ncbi:hypothetical protein CRT60_21950 [Azospirillum palustre]|uniref:GMT-like wHTH domain-containing protein n=1 Tax=Azospirillum palustre TaxID=2044885 RepID=A0A2B8BAZ1_9PROT|nr:three-Cys-motif partner protein TcmP [Azospirillum palustre]PGH55916.1 hypothetical protein CRT60_21950 [Azospirillum palustre]
MAQKFFEERSDQSEVKARIVSKYFKVWAKIIAPSARTHHGKMAYIDLYAGPGRYKDGAASTPLMVLETAIADPQLRNLLVTVFNEGDKATADTLFEEIEKLKDIGLLKFKPTVHNQNVDESIADMLAKTKLVPSFSFVDPFGYKGLSQKIINGVIKDWGCDCVLFFNYNRINAGISNILVESHMEALFGPTRAAQLRASVQGQVPAKREALVIEAIAQSIKEMGGTYVLPFRFRSETGARLSHCLIFVSKHVLGYEIMKEIMATESSTEDQGIASFAYSPADAATPLLFSLARPLDGLADDLCQCFAGRTLKMVEIYRQHHVDTPYISRNYKEALRQLEGAGRIIARPAAVDRPMRKGQRTFGDDVSVTFL